MKTEHINNLISAVTCAVDQIHRSQLRDLNEVRDHLNNTDLYGDLSEEVVSHIDSVLTNILCQKDQDDLDDYYSDFDLQ